jgi:hypothetical protein
MRRDWVLPVLEDIKAFLEHGEMPDMADDLQGLIDRYRDRLLEVPPEDEMLPSKVTRLKFDRDR